MHPLTHPLPVTAHVSLLDKNSLTPARASVNGTTRTSDQDFESVYAHCQSENASNSGLESKKPTQSRFFYIRIRTRLNMTMTQ